MITGVDFVTLGTEDFDRVVAFYTETLGLPESARYGQMPGVEFDTGTVTLAVIQSDAFGMTFQPSVHPFAFQVDDVAQARQELEAKGVTFAAETMDTGVCHMAIFNDPDGNLLMLHKRYAPRT